ncbi:hypothetical protein EJ573_07410 [Paenibacillus polymyxa]|nr:hypothetical protein FGY93_02235 [Paenibacillus polymyxa]RTZ36669.1 hypothetical protein EJ573_07410 [Paenibacillus polymyxa]
MSEFMTFVKVINHNFISLKKGLAGTAVTITAVFSKSFLVNLAVCFLAPGTRQLTHIGFKCCQ